MTGRGLRLGAEMALAMALIQARQALGKGEEPQWGEIGALLARTDADRFVAMTTAHLVLPALAGPLAQLGRHETGQDRLVAFAGEIAEANAARNRHLLQGLGQLNGALGAAGILPVALKGAAFLAERAEDAAGWRFMNDLDLLVPAGQLDAAVAAVTRLGFRGPDEVYTPETEAHFPPLVAPCGTYSVELHTRLFGRSDFGIDCHRLREEAHRVALGDGATIAVPSAVDRVAHVAAHAQLHNRQALAQRIVLKDLVDLVMLPGTALTAYCDPASGRLPLHAGERDDALGLVAAYRRIVNRHSDPGLPAASERWAKRAAGRLGWSPRQLQLALPFDLLRMEATRLAVEPGHLGRRLALVTDGVRRRRVADQWSYKLRQRHWS